MLGWGDGYFKGPKESEISEMKHMDQEGREEDQQLRRKVLRELQALVSNSEDDISDYVTDTEWFYLVSMSHSFAHGVGYDPELKICFRLKFSFKDFHCFILKVAGTGIVYNSFVIVCHDQSNSATQLVELYPAIIFEW